MNRVDSPPRYILFGTSACHLCEVAEQMLVEQRRVHPDLNYEKVDISESNALFERYGVRIPVLRDPVGRELGWPFTPAQLEEFVSLQDGAAGPSQ